MFFTDSEEEFETYQKEKERDGEEEMLDEEVVESAELRNSRE